MEVRVAIPLLVEQQFESIVRGMKVKRATLVSISLKAAFGDLESIAWLRAARALHKIDIDEEVFLNELDVEQE